MENAFFDASDPRFRGAHPRHCPVTSDSFDVDDNGPFSPSQPTQGTMPLMECECKRIVRKCRTLERTIFLAWSYLLGEGMWEDVVEYIKEHSDDPTPLDLGMGIFQS